MITYCTKVLPLPCSDDKHNQQGKLSPLSEFVKNAECIKIMEVTDRLNAKLFQCFYTEITITLVGVSCFQALTFAPSHRCSFTGTLQPTFLSQYRPTEAQNSNERPLQEALWVMGTEERCQSLKDDSLSELVAATS